MVKIWIVKKSDLAGSSAKRIEWPEKKIFKDDVYVEVTDQELRARKAEYWGK